jgi:phosphatidylglycerol---prolipoprotein diacylglyceryl transferase
VDILAVFGWPVLDRIRLGPVAISPHGIGIAAGYLLGAWWMLREGPKRGLREEHIGTILLWALVGAIVGARAFYVLGHFEEFDDVVDVLAVWRGGITLVGGILGAMIFAYPFMRKYGYRFTQVMDSAAVGLAFGITFGRIGDLIIGDHLGTPTDFFLGFQYVGGELPGPWRSIEGTEQWIAVLADGKTQVLSEQGSQLCQGPCSPETLLQTGAGVHQTALYDMLIAGGLFLVLWWLSRRPRREGTLIAIFAVWYGAGRILTDGEAVPLPTRLQFDRPEPSPNSDDVDFYKKWKDGPEDLDVDKIVDRWRKQTR